MTEKLDTHDIKKILAREGDNGEIGLPGPPNIERLTVGGRFSLLNRISNGNALQKALGGISDPGESGLSISEGQLITLAE